MASSKVFFFSWLTAHFLYTTVAGSRERFHAWTSRRSEALALWVQQGSLRLETRASVAGHFCPFLKVH